MRDIILEALERFDVAIADMQELPLPERKTVVEFDDDLLTEYAIALWRICKAVDTFHT